jgi:dephospho-CoA kinase
MLRVGLTGGLGSGKSTAAKLFAAHGAHVLHSDAIGRELMEPGQEVYKQIVAHFGPAIVLPDGTLDRPALSRIAFAEGRAGELNAIVHPAVIARQGVLIEEIACRHPEAIVIVESALIIEAVYEPGHGTKVYGPKMDWQQRFDRMVLVTAPEEVKIARFVRRCFGDGELSEARRDQLESEARRRLALQMPDEQKMALCDYVLVNDGAETELQWQVDQLWPILRLAAS